MPEISRFFGIVITMYFDDHAPAHFHARYGSFRVVVDITTGAVEGSFPRRGLALVEEWRALHSADLLENWRLARAGEALQTIAGLE